MAQKNNKKGKRVPAYSTDTMVVCLIVGLLLIALGVMIFLATAIGMEGDVFAGFRQFSRGMCGALSMLLAAVPVWGGVLVMLATQRKPPVRPFLLACVLLVLLCTAATLVSYTADGLHLMESFQAKLTAAGLADSMSGYLNRAFAYGSQNSAAGGLLGMLLAWPLWKGLGPIGGAVVTILAMVVTFLFLIRLDVKGIITRSKTRKDERRARQAEEEQRQRQQEIAWQQEQARIQQEQLRLRQEQMRLQQEQLRQQQMQRTAYQQPVYDPGVQPVPIVRQVQTGRSVQPVQQVGFRPTPEELGETAAPRQMTAPQPIAEEAPKKKRGGVFNRSKETEPRAISRRRSIFDRETGPAAPVQPVVTEQPELVAPPVEETPPRRRSIFQRPEPVMDEPEVVYTPEPEIFTPEPAAPVARPATAARQATGPVAPVRPPEPLQPVTEPEPAPEPAQKPVSENSFLARLRAARRAEGLEVPDETPAPTRKTRKDTPSAWSEGDGGNASWREDGSTPPRPTARSAAKAAKPAPAPSWEETPPWEDAPGAAEESSAPLRPVVTQKKPEGGYEPELNLKPRRSGSDLPAGPMFEEKAEVPYVFPTMDLLKAPEPPQGISEEEDAIRSRRLENTLQSFRIPAKVRHITHGPAISRFELEIAAGIKVSRVTDLNRNIAMNMEVKSVRIEAPIPGKALVGVEVPNRQRSLVTLRELLESEPMRSNTNPLVVALGRDIAGTPIICDLAKMPHLLIAGATGSGKSVCINTIINSLLFRCSPKDVRLIMIDPKVVELQCYNGIPHLLIPVVSDPHKASGALAWAVGEMMDRYHRFQEAGSRNIDGYNENLPAGEEKMPRIVIIIDELADLMMTCKKDVEERINRLAQLARAAGIHLIVATQRPSVDVITGLIKANIPSRIAFKVSSNVDSRTILGTGGAEQLLGYGDMLYAPTTEFTHIRVQGCFLSDAEVNRITDFIRDNCPSDYDPAVLEELERLQSESDSGGSSLPEMPAADEYTPTDGSLLTQCIEMAVNDGQVSTSLIQRRLKLGYARAGRLVDEMEKRGIVSAKDGAKPRMCLISREEFEAMKGAGELD